MNKIETTREERELAAVHHYGAGWAKRRDVASFVEGIEDPHSPFHHMREDALLLAQYREKLKRQVHEATLDACKSEEVVIDELPRRLRALEITGNLDTHHAKLIRVILGLYISEKKAT